MNRFQAAIPKSLALLVILLTSSLRITNAVNQAEDLSIGTL